MATRVLVLFGGRSGEHEVSLRSARHIFFSLRETGYDAITVGIGKNGRWYLHPGYERAVKDGVAQNGEEVFLSPVPGDRCLFTRGGRRVSFDVAFPVLHGPMGEDGTVQGLLELAEVPYVGAPVAASAVGMDKVLMKTVFGAHGLNQVSFLSFLATGFLRDREGVIRQVEGGLGYPVFVKPANMGSSVGVSKARDRHELIAAIELAVEYDRKFLVEEAVRGAREIECSVLGNDEPAASVPGEIVPGNEFYDYRAKYIDDTSELLIPAPLDDETVRKVQQMSVKAFKAIDCSGMARVDFLMADNGEIYLNEINTIPGFTEISMYPKLWEASGIPGPELVRRLVDLALERRQEKDGLRTSYEES